VVAGSFTTLVHPLLDDFRQLDSELADAASYELARRAYWLTIANSVSAAGSAVAAIVAIVVAIMCRVTDPASARSDQAVMPRVAARHYRLKS
jgi:hypothetical protein